GRVEREAVVEPEHARFAERTVEDVEDALPFPQVRKRRVAASAADVPEDRVAVREGAAARVLAGEAHRRSFVEQAREREVLADGPVERLGARSFREPGARLEQL